MPFATVFVALFLTPPGTPAGGFHWQRILTPPHGAAMAQACVVLDAATFSNAAPALRDLRLFQDGVELPYVIEESYDERALNGGTTPADDRSEYEVVATAPMSPYLSNHVPAGMEAHFMIEARVPVERIRVESNPGIAHTLRITAAIGDPGNAGLVESVIQVLPAGQQSAPFTLGANLQHKAELTVTDTAPGTRSERIFAEMRKRSLCYQPQSASPLVLYLGGGQGMAAKVYGLANGFSTAVQRPYATMGPLEPNPDQQHARARHAPRLLIALLAMGAALLFTLSLAVSSSKKEKSRPEAAHS